MLRVPITNARAGMVLAEAVWHPHVPKAVLLRPGAALEAPSIAKLSELGVHEVWIRYPGLEDLVKFISPEVQEARRELTGHIAVAIDSAMVQSRVELDFHVFRRAVVGLLDRLAEHPHAAVFLADLTGGDRPLLRHSGNVCVLSLLMGVKLDFYLVRERTRLSAATARDIAPLGVGAMFHDIGMTRLSPEATARWNATHDESDPAWREHVQHGFDMVKENLDPAAAGVVLHHHQKFDGTGFPCIPSLDGSCIPPRGSHIHVFARIAGAADLFDRLRHPAHAPGATRPSLPAVRALSMMRQAPYSAWIDPIVFRALISVAPPYPPGSVVTLSDSRHAAVVGWSPDDPCRPTVEIIDSLTPEPRRGEALRERLDLRRCDGLEIASIDGHATRADNFYPATPGEFDLMNVARALSGYVPPVEHAHPTKAKGQGAG